MNSVKNLKCIYFGDSYHENIDIKTPEHLFCHVEFNGQTIIPTDFSKSLAYSEPSQVLKIEPSREYT